MGSASVDLRLWKPLTRAAATITSKAAARSEVRSARAATLAYAASRQTADGSNRLAVVGLRGLLVSLRLFDNLLVEILKVIARSSHGNDCGSCVFGGKLFGTWC